MLTREGRVVAVAAFVLVAAGRLFGIFELYVIGAGAAALVIVAIVVVTQARIQLDIIRDLHPQRVHVGNPSRVAVQVHNGGLRRSPLLTLRDPIGDGRSASVVVAPLPADERVQASYRLPTDRRGILHIGPLSVEVADPFGLAAVTVRGAPVAELTVWPAVDDIAALPHTTGDDPHGGADHPNVLSARGDDFYALRPYVIGDDLRHVHWRSTARYDDELMVRQDELPWQGRVTVLLDARWGAYGPDAFEGAVSAAASIVVSCARRRFLLRLVTTAGDDSGYGAGNAHVEGILERLATVQLTREGTLSTVVTGLRRAGGGALAALIGGRQGDDLAPVGRLRPTFTHLTIVAFHEGTAPPAPAGVLVVDDAHPFATVWQTAVGTDRRLRGRPVQAGQ